MARKPQNADQGDLFSILDEEGAGDQSRNSADRDRGVHQPRPVAIGVDVPTATGVPGSGSGSAEPPGGRVGGGPQRAGHPGMDQPDRGSSGRDGQGRTGEQRDTAGQGDRAVPGTVRADPTATGGGSGPESADAGSQRGALGSAVDTHPVPDRADRGSRG